MLSSSRGGRRRSRRLEPLEGRLLKRLELRHGHQEATRLARDRRVVAAPPPQWDEERAEHIIVLDKICRGVAARAHCESLVYLFPHLLVHTTEEKEEHLSLSLSPQRLDSLASLSSSRLPVPQSELSEFLRQCLRSCSLRAHLFSRQTKGRRRECMSISKTPTWSQIIRIELSGKRRRLSEGGDSRNSFMVGGTTSFFKEQHNFTWQQYLDDEEDEFLLTAFVRLSAPVSGS